MSGEAFLLYCATVLVASASPGPVMLLALANGAQVGMRRTLVAILGSSLGHLALILLSFAGLSALLHSSALLFALVKWAGAIYLIYLGIAFWRNAGADAIDIENRASIRRDSAQRALFTRAFAVAASNPKGLVFFGALFPQFISADAPPLPQWALLAATFFLVDWCWQLAYAASGLRLVQWLGARRRWFNRIAGGLFVGAGVLLSAAKRT